MTSLYPLPRTMTPGAQLSAARDAAGLTLADVAARSRVPVSALQAIEEDDYGRLPAIAYARGFLRLYAREVGLEAEAVLALFDEFQSQEETPVNAGYAPYVTGAHRAAVARRRRNSPAFGLAVGAVVTAIVVALLWSPTDGVDSAKVGSDYSKGSVELSLDKP